MTQPNKFQQYQHLFDRRRAGANFKALSTYFQLIKDGSDRFVIQRRRSKWVEVDAGNGKKEWRRVQLTPDDFATVENTENGTILTLVMDVGAFSVAEKFFLGEQLGGNVYSDSGNFARHTHKVRLSLRQSSSEPKKTYPVSAGLKVNLDTRTVVSHAPDTFAVVNKAASKPINDYTRKVIKVMETMYKLGAFEGHKRDWYADKEALQSIDPTDLSDDKLGTVADAIYRYAQRVTSMPAEVEYDSAVVNGQWMSRKIVRTDAQRKTVFLERLRRNARKHLAHLLREHNGGYERVEV